MRIHRGHRPASPHDGDGVGQREDLLQLVRDEDDGDSLRLQLPKVPKEVIHLLWNEDGGRFVQDQDPGPPVQHLDDLDPLALTDTQVLHEPARIERDTVAARELPDSLPGSIEIDEPTASGLRTEDHVLENRQVVGQHEVLVHHPDAGRDGFLRRTKVDRVPRDPDRAFVGTLHAIQDLHERRLAGTVLADHGVDLAGHHPKVHVIVRDDAREALADRVQLHDRNDVQLAACNRLGHGHPLLERVRAAWRPGPFRRVPFGRASSTER